MKPLEGFFFSYSALLMDSPLWGSIVSCGNHIIIINKETSTRCEHCSSFGVFFFSSSISSFLVSSVSRNRQPLFGAANIVHFCHLSFRLSSQLFVLFDFGLRLEFFCARGYSAQMWLLDEARPRGHCHEKRQRWSLYRHQRRICVVTVESARIHNPDGSVEWKHLGRSCSE